MILYIIVPVAIIILILAFVVIFKKKEPISKQNEKQVISGSLFVTLNEKYLYLKEVEFYYFLKEILPKEFIAFPKVGVDNLVVPTGSRIGYNAVLSKFVDFVVFEESTMKPVLVIDVYDNSFGDEILQEQEPNVSKALEEVKLPVISVLIKSMINKDEIAKQIIDKIVPKSD